MRSKRANEAYVLIEHRNSPGLSPEFCRKHGIPVAASGAGNTYESAMAVCKHCTADLPLGGDRSYDPVWCSKCDAYICELCALALRQGYAHETIEQRTDSLYKRSLLIIT